MRFSLEKLNKIIDILKSKWLANTGKTAILIALIIIIFLGMNLIVQKINPKDIDLTPDKLYSLSDESRRIVGALPEEDEIEIYMCDFKDNDPIVEMIKQYTQENKNIKVEAIENLDERPDLKTKYGIDTGFYTIVIASGEKQKIFTQYEFSSYDQITGQSIDLTEQKMTNGIVSVSSIGQITPVYMLTGHEEYSIHNYMTYFNTLLELENYEVKELDLLSQMNVPEECRALIIASPKKDITDGEASAIKAYIEKGGNILWLSDTYSSEGETPNLKSILDLYGVTVRQDGIVLEQETSKMIQNSPSFVRPTLGQSAVTTDVSQGALLFSAGKLEFAENLSDLGVTRTDLLTTSDKSFFRTNLEDISMTPKEGETVGMNVLGAILEKTAENEENNSSLIIYTNAMFATDAPILSGNTRIPAIAVYSNQDLILNSVEYVADVEDPITIRKDMEITQYTATEAQDRLIKIIIFGLPILIIISGIVIWQLRRRKK